MHQKQNKTEKMLVIVIADIYCSLFLCIISEETGNLKGSCFPEISLCFHTHIHGTLHANGVMAVLFLLLLHFINPVRSLIVMIVLSLTQLSTG